MKLTFFTRYFLITDSKKFSQALSDAIYLAENNPKLSFRLICVLNGNKKLSQIVKSNMPDNLCLIRYACNREFDLGYALINYLIKSHIKQTVVINKQTIEKLPRFKIIKNGAINFSDLSKNSRLMVINKEKFSTQFKLNSKLLNTINCFIDKDFNTEGL